MIKKRLKEEENKLKITQNKIVIIKFSPQYPKESTSMIFASLSKKLFFLCSLKSLKEPWPIATRMMYLLLEVLAVMKDFNK